MPCIISPDKGKARRNLNGYRICQVALTCLFSKPTEERREEKMCVMQKKGVRRRLHTHGLEGHCVLEAAGKHIASGVMQRKGAYLYWWHDIMPISSVPQFLLLYDGDNISTHINCHLVGV